MKRNSRARVTFGAMVSALTMGALLDASPAAAACRCDCGQDGSVTVEEILTVINIVLDSAPLGSCAGVDGGDGEVTVDEVLGCVVEALNGCGPMETVTPTPTPTATPSPFPQPTTTAGVPPIPTTPRELLAWLQVGYYRTWTAESAPHASGGPHGGTVRTYLNDTVLESLRTGAATHPAGSAIVKELYFSGTTVRNWAVEIKVQDDSAGGAGWYWWEGVSLQGFGLGVCTSCHGGNYRSYVSKDFVLTPFPLQ